MSETPSPFSSSPPGSGASAGRAGSSLALAPGTQLQEFRVTGVIGEGGFGIVYLADDSLLHRRVAIKEYMPTQLATRTSEATVQVKAASFSAAFDAGRRSFVNEARMLAQFKHAALVEVFRFWEQNGTAYMAMPYYEGPTLRSYLNNTQHNVSQLWLAKLLLPLTQALEHMHATKVYHRDIAPDNVLILANEQPVLLDLGAARRIVSEATQAVTVMLKPGYAPIEQYADDESIKQGPWTDVYALAAMIYFAIARKSPVPSVARIALDTLVPLPSIAPAGFSPEFLQAVQWGLAVRPHERPQSMAEFREALGLNQILANQRNAAPAGLSLAESPALGAMAEVTRRQRTEPAPVRTQAPAVTGAAPVPVTHLPTAPSAPASALPADPEVATAPAIPLAAEPETSPAPGSPQASSVDPLELLGLGGQAGPHGEPAPLTGLLQATGGPPQTTLAPGFAATPEAGTTATQLAPARTETRAVDPVTVLPEAPQPKPETRAPARNNLLLIGLAVLAALMIGVGYYMKSGREAPQPAIVPSAEPPGQARAPAAEPAASPAPIPEAAKPADSPAPPAASSPANPAATAAPSPAPASPAAPAPVPVAPAAAAPASTPTASPAPSAQTPPAQAQSAPAPKTTAPAATTSPGTQAPGTAPAVTGVSPEAPVAPATVSFSVKPWGEVLIDEVSKGVSPPLKRLPLPPGKHRIEIRNSAGPSLIREVDLKAGEKLGINHQF